MFDLDPDDFPVHHACAFIEYLALQLTSPKSISNYISSVRQYLLRRGHEHTSFNQHWVAKEIDYHAKRKDHQVTRMMPLFPYNIKKVMSFSYHQGADAQIRLAFGFMYYLGFRQSEVAPYSVKSFNPAKNITRDDVAVTGQMLWIHQRWAKNLKYHDQNRGLFLPKSKDPTTCPYTFLLNALQEAPTRFQNQPLLVFPDYNPLTTPFLTDIFRRGVQAIGLDPSTHSLHSFRRSASTHANEAGFSSDTIQRFGGWMGTSHELYIKNKAQVTVSTHRVDNLAAIDLSRPEGEQSLTSAPVQIMNHPKDTQPKKRPGRPKKAK